MSRISHLDRIQYTSPAASPAPTKPPHDAARQLIKMARSLARPVIQRQFSIDEAHGLIEWTTHRAWRTGQLPFDPVPFACILRHILRLHLEHGSSRIARIEAAIERAVAPLIALRKPLNRIQAEGHDAAADAAEGSEFRLHEHEVEDQIKIAISQAMHESHHGR